MPHTNSDEIDLFQIFNKIKEKMNSWVVLLFQVFNFIIKYKIVIFILIVVGAGLGYISQKNNKPDQKAIALIRISFDSVDYVYSETELLNEKIKERDSLFFINNGFRADTLEMREIEISPIVNLKDILEKYELNDRKLEGLLRNLEFDDDEIKLYETFNSEYKYHKINFNLSHVANKETIKHTIDYFNNNELLQNLKETVINDVKSQIKNNLKSIKQIDDVIETYQTNKSLTSPSAQIFVVDKNFSLHVLFERKLEFQELNHNLVKFLAFSKNIVVLVNKPNIVAEKTKLFEYKIIVYPIFLVALFLLLFLMKFIFINLRNIANRTSENT